MRKSRIQPKAAGLAMAALLMAVVAASPAAKAAVPADRGTPSAEDASEPGADRSAGRAGAASSAPEKRIAVVIDDFGNGMKGTEQMIGLPIPLTTAVMPFLPTTKKDAEAAHAKGHDVIIHLPMEPVRGKASWLGPNAILTRLDDAEIRRRVEAAVADVPYAVGMNNHMGSKATADERVVRIVLQVCKEKGLFFLDSRTSAKSVVPQIAKELGVPLLQNDVFLDDVYTSTHIAKQIQVLKRRVEKKENTIVIGHVGPPGLLTSGALKAAIPSLGADARFVKLSTLLAPPIAPPAAPVPRASGE